MTFNKEVVWEFINPLYSTGSVAAGYTYPVVACLFNDGGLGGSATTLNPTSIHKSTRILANDPALAGKDLSRKYLLAKGCPEFWKLLTYPAVGTPGPTTGWTLSYPVIPSYTGFGFGYSGTATTSTGGGGGGAGGGGGGY